MNLHAIEDVALLAGARRAKGKHIDTVPRRHQGLRLPSNADINVVVILE